MNPEYVDLMVLVWYSSVKLSILTKSSSKVVDRVLFLNFMVNVSVSTLPVNMYSLTLSVAAVKTDTGY